MITCSFLISLFIFIFFIPRKKISLINSNCTVCSSECYFPNGCTLRNENILFFYLERNTSARRYLLERSALVRLERSRESVGRSVDESRPQCEQYGIWLGPVSAPLLTDVLKSVFRRISPNIRNYTMPLKDLAFVLAATALLRKERERETKVRERDRLTRLR